MTTAELRRLLQAAGHRTDINAHGDIAFQALGKQACAATQADDPDFVRFFLDFRLEGEASEFELLQVLDRIARLKCVKATLRRHQGSVFLIRLSIESFADAEVLARHLPRCIALLCTAVRALDSAASAAGPHG